MVHRALFTDHLEEGPSKHTINGITGFVKGPRPCTIMVKQQVEGPLQAPQATTVLTGLMVLTPAPFLTFLTNKTVIKLIIP